MLNYHKDIENAECRRDGYAEVTRDNALSMIADKCRNTSKVYVISPRWWMKE